MLLRGGSKVLITQVEGGIRGPGDYEWAVFMHRVSSWITEPEVEGIVEITLQASKWSVDNMSGFTGHMIRAKPGLVRG